MCYTYKYEDRLQRINNMGITQLSDYDIRQMAAMRAAGVSQVRAAKFFGIRQPQISLLEHVDPYARIRAIYQSGRQGGGVVV
jgi:hypothetical protein